MYHKLNQMVVKGDSTAWILSDYLYPTGRLVIFIYSLEKLFPRTGF